MVQHNLIVIHPSDNVGILKYDVMEGETIRFERSEFVAKRNFSLGDKIAIKPIPNSMEILKYGSHIGSATSDISQGDWVHLHNMKSDYVKTVTFSKSGT